MTTLETLLKQVEELDASYKNAEPDFRELIRHGLTEAAPILAEVTRKLVEQRNHYHAVCYRDLEPAIEDESLRKRNNDLDAIVAKRLKGEE